MYKVEKVYFYFSPENKSFLRLLRGCILICFLSGMFVPIFQTNSTEKLIQSLYWQDLQKISNSNHAHT